MSTGSELGGGSNQTEPKKPGHEPKSIEHRALSLEGLTCKIDLTKAVVLKTIRRRSKHAGIGILFLEKSTIGRSCFRLCGL